jgi:hypothetical protein
MLQYLESSRTTRREGTFLRKTHTNHFHVSNVTIHKILLAIKREGISCSWAQGLLPCVSLWFVGLCVDTCARMYFQWTRGGGKQCYGWYIWYKTVHTVGAGGRYHCRHTGSGVVCQSLCHISHDGHISTNNMAMRPVHWLVRSSALLRFTPQNTGNQPIVFPACAL